MDYTVYTIEKKFLYGLYVGPGLSKNPDLYEAHSAVRVELVSTPELNFGVKSFQVLTPECSIPIQQLFNTDPLWCWISVDTGNTQYQFNNYSTQSLFCVESVLTPRSVQPGLNWCQHFLYLLLNMHLCPWFLTTSIAQSVKAPPKKTRLTPIQHRHPRRPDWHHFNTRVRDHFKTRVRNRISFFKAASAARARSII